MNLESKIEEIAQEKRKALDKLGFFDANLWLGKPLYFPLARELEVEQIERVFLEYWIKGALVSHWDGVALSAQDGNRELLEAGDVLPENVCTVWTGLPLAPKEQQPLPGFNPPDRRLRGVRLFPKSHNYLPSRWVLGGLCEWCVKYRIPLFFWHVEIDWEHLYQLATSYPGLTMVVESQWQKILYHNRSLYSLLDSTSNVYLETSNFVGQDFITHAVKTFGAERLIFGSFLPVNDPFTSMGMIGDADITQREKKAIAGENLKKIIEEVGA
jgi:hypothetical protein